MYRFQITPQRKSGKKLWFSLFLFILLILLFSLGTSSLSENTVRRQKDSLTQALNRFLAALPKQERYLFVRQYWDLDSIRTLSEQTGLSESKTASMLYRLRKSLKKMLTEEELL